MPRVVLASVFGAVVVPVWGGNGRDVVCSQSHRVRVRRARRSPCYVHRDLNPLGTGTHLEVVVCQKPLPFEFRVTEGTSWSRKPPGLSRLPLQASSPNHIPERGVSLPAGDGNSSPPRLHPPVGWEVGVIPPCPWLSPELTSPLFLPAAPADRRQFLRAGF